MTEHAHGLLAEFASAEQLVGAVRRARHEECYSAIEVYSPFPLAGLDEMLGHHLDGVPRWMLLGAFVGGVATYALEWYSAVIDYPLNVGGRPTASWPAFLPAALEMAILGAVLFGVISMLIGNGLPRLHHPLFDVKAFERASSDRFFLLLGADDPNFDAQRARQFVDTLSPLSVSEVPR